MIKYDKKKDVWICCVCKKEFETTTMLLNHCLAKHANTKRKKRLKEE